MSLQSILIVFLINPQFSSTVAYWKKVLIKAYMAFLPFDLMFAS